VFEKLTKKERLMKGREIERLQGRLGGIRNMERLPAFLFIVDVLREYTAVQEANSLNIPIIGVVDTNSNPDQVDYIIPANDDAIRAIRLLTAAIADAVLEGKALRKAYHDGEEETVDFEAEVNASRYDDVDDDTAYLGKSTLAKLRDGDLRFDDEFEDEG
jgi:small subunit ribosomal protein S2